RVGRSASTSSMRPRSGNAIVSSAMAPSYAQVVGHKDHDFVEIALIPDKSTVNSGLSCRQCAPCASDVNDHATGLPPTGTDALNDRVHRPGRALEFDCGLANGHRGFGCSLEVTFSPLDRADLQSTAAEPGRGTQFG